MKPALKIESEQLARSWSQHAADWLRDYLVAGPEDPRLNLQSILSRHFLIRAALGAQFQALMEQEYRFSAAANWLLNLATHGSNADEFQAILHALERGADNAEGLELPSHLLASFAALPANLGSLTVPNYLRAFLSRPAQANERAELAPTALDTFASLWEPILAEELAAPTRPGGVLPNEAAAGRTLLAAAPPAHRSQGGPLSLLEPACGSANDYRFLRAYGLTRLFDYTGFDLCYKNVENARRLFPDARFAMGNVFEIDAPDKSFDFCLAHDLFEHLSLEGLEAAVKEVCRVTRRGMCIGFFNMDQIPDHLVCPTEEYYWNILSMQRMRELFASLGFAAQVVHIGTFLRQHVGSEQTHNANAYSFMLWTNT